MQLLISNKEDYSVVAEISATSNEDLVAVARPKSSKSSRKGVNYIFKQIFFIFFLLVSKNCRKAVKVHIAYQQHL